MFNKGDRVILVEPFQGYRPGAEGVVLFAPQDDDSVTVSIDKDDQGNSVSPPDPLLPTESSYFRIAEND